ncbi:hypothetical protein [Jannaschia sp. CCS1]|uniref:hypothetical protein n=1 Tax=Jannaschia sp. (strain CCS1) TaxID=290400 RepID=UPI000053DD4A|nr:hypothetical protein [Jannaschia sp. CCS1]ABD55934.1 hypothetical protein Jann_3017 [Jannaschia sp. CCS1]
MTTLSTFQLREVLAVSANGVPTLNGSNARILATARFSEAEIGAKAVCQPVLDADEPTLIVLGVIQPDAPQDNDDAPVVLRSGAASLALHPDGRIRMTGEDIAIDAAAGLNLLAARIDLN